MRCVTACLHIRLKPRIQGDFKAECGGTVTQPYKLQVIALIIELAEKADGDDDNQEQEQLKETRTSKRQIQSETENIQQA
jgi:hypothetical protein